MSAAEDVTEVLTHMAPKPAAALTADELLTPEELAAELKRPVGTMYKWHQRGLGPKGIRLGRTIVFRRDDVLSWLDEQAKQSA